MKLYDLTSDISIVVASNADSAIMMAATDLQDNLRYLSGKDAGFPIVTTMNTTPAIIIDTVAGETPEQYRVEIGENAITITGSDILGTVYGIYAFSNKQLGFMPIYRLAERYPKKRDSLELAETAYCSKPHSVRFRGWFINDEDLLGDFKHQGGVRELDMMFYKKVLNPDVLNMVLEVALRMEMNLIIPASLIDICNPPEAALVELCVRRGMYVSQHHVEPVGVSYFTAEKYIKAHGAADETPSFVTNPERMKEIWRHYIEKWAVYGDRIVWQLGLRGKGDQAIWKVDPNVPADDASRGRIITDAIRAQYEIIASVLGHRNFASTATLWVETSALYRTGDLQLPQNTMVIFSDLGYTQMLSRAFFEVPRLPGVKYGVYPHVAFWVEGPHLAECCDIRKIVYTYQQAKKFNSLEYSILNVSNVRPLHYSAWFNALLLQNADQLDPEAIFEYLMQTLYGDAAPLMKELTCAYYDALGAVNDRDKLDRYARIELDYYDYGELPFPEFVMTDGYLRYAGRRMMLDLLFAVDEEAFEKSIYESLANWQALYERMCTAESKLPEEAVLYFQQYLKFETLYMMELTRWLVNVHKMYFAKNKEDMTQAKDAALAALDHILQERKILEQGYWEGWHDGDCKIGIPTIRELTVRTYQDKTSPDPNACSRKSMQASSKFAM